MLVLFFFIIIGFFWLIIGANILVDGAVLLAKKLHIADIIIGLTIVSMGTSMPELFVSATSALEGHADMAIGNAIGSNVCNLLLILGLSSIIRPISFKKETIKYEIPISFIATIIFIIVCNTELTINISESIILILLFIMFIIYTLILAKKLKSNIPQKRHEKEKIFNSIFLIILGIISLKYGGDFVVNSAVKMAELFGVSEKIISITILAVGTSLPELVTSVTAAIKGNSDIAIGNIIGSNIFNILFIIGFSGILGRLTLNPLYNIDLVILLISTLVLEIFPFFYPKNKMGRIDGVIYFLMYVVYLGILFVI